jgi:hypothetical protein
MNTSNPLPSLSATEATPFDDGALYDLVVGNLDHDLDFYLGMARTAGGPVLDVACGSEDAKRIPATFLEKFPCSE